MGRMSCKHSLFTTKKNMSKTRIELKNLEPIQVRLHHLAQAGEELEATLQEIANLLYNRTAEAIESETAPMARLGHPWPIPLKQGQGKILWEDGHLQRSLSVKVDEETVILGLHATHDGFPYPTTHQFGMDKAERGKNVEIPARPFCPLGRMMNCWKRSKKQFWRGWRIGFWGSND